MRWSPNILLSQVGPFCPDNFEGSRVPLLTNLLSPTTSGGYHIRSIGLGYSLGTPTRGIQFGMSWELKDSAVLYLAVALT